ncbi:sperm acrosome-associated protein 5-like [Sceloporus undulatus]|uniref:sperm acrosome-associated protein 5-like n=1 Tax=Sceloporus undulatus TaxID=8520 RepID=UPI001C4C9AEC|nr:sperm acrosome-associated protein 5-like [Sceloporus undulatus]
MDGYGGYSLGDWLCLLYYTSSYNTKYKSRDMFTRNRYGIFQIDSGNWCFDGCVVSKNQCHTRCEMMADNDLLDDIICAKRIVMSSADIYYWPAWREYCDGYDNSKWENRC